jgi:hypothetical protein
VTRLVGLATLLGFLSLSAPAFALDKEQCVAASESAQKLRTQKKLRAARKELISCAQEDCPAVVKKDCLTWLAEVEESVPTIVISAKDGSGADLADVRVSLDGEALTEKLDGSAIAVDPGLHTFRFEVIGVEPVENKIMIREGERNRSVTVTIGKKPAPAPAPVVAPPPKAPEKPETSTTIPTATWVFGAVGIAGLVGFTYFGLSGRADRQKLLDTCAPYCNKDDEKPARNKFILADVSLGVSIVSLGLATVFALTNKNEPKKAAIRVDVMPLASGGAAMIAGSF